MDLESNKQIKLRSNLSKETFGSSLAKASAISDLNYQDEP